ncbi:MAG: hypothetical protein AAFN59_14120 [Pseudomonadota bacterium]
MTEMTRHFSKDDNEDGHDMVAQARKNDLLRRRSSALVHNSQTLVRDSLTVRERIERIREQLEDLHNRLSHGMGSNGV